MTLNGSIVMFFVEEIWCKWLQAFQVVLVVKNLPANTGDLRDATRASFVAQLVKNQPAMRETWVRSLGWEDPLEEGMATHSSVLAWRSAHGQRSLAGYSPWGHKESDTTEQLHFHFLLSYIGEGNGNPLPCPCLENPRDGGAWWAAVFGVAQSQTRLK